MICEFSLWIAEVTIFNSVNIILKVSYKKDLQTPVLLHYYVLQDKSGQKEQLFESRRRFTCKASG